MHSLDVATFPNGKYVLTMMAEHGRGNTGMATFAHEFANGVFVFLPL